MDSYLKKLVGKIVKPKLDWIQLEITTKCNAECSYCPNNYIKKSKDISLDIFYRLIPFISNTDLVYLQGWGEPLLNSNIYEMIKICKNEGKKVGFTTNAMSLNEQVSNRLVDLQLDILCVSLAGTSPKTNNQLRKGTDFKQIISNLKLLRQIKDEKKSFLPAIHLAYLMLKSNFEEIKYIVPISKEVGAEQIVASNLTLIIKQELYQEALFNDTVNCKYYSLTLNEVRQQAVQQDIVFSYSKPSIQNSLLNCSENVCYSSVIDVEGNVSPCVFTMPTLNNSNKNRSFNYDKVGRIFKGQLFPFSKMTFGNIVSESFSEIWKQKDYKTFRDYFRPSSELSKLVGSEMPESCKKCYKGLSV